MDCSYIGLEGSSFLFQLYTEKSSMSSTIQSGGSGNNFGRQICCPSRQAPRRITTSTSTSSSPSSSTTPMCSQQESNKTSRHPPVAFPAYLHRNTDTSPSAAILGFGMDRWSSLCGTWRRRRHGLGCPSPGRRFRKSLLLRRLAEPCSLGPRW